MYSLIYVSIATGSPTTADLLALLQQSRTNNARLGVTGILLYKERSFIQLLEGEQDAVKALYAKIERDPRHRNPLTIREEAIDNRVFPDWSMAFRDLGSPEVAATPGYSEFLNTPLTPAEFCPDPTRVQRLLRVFHAS